MPPNAICGCGQAVATHYRLDTKLPLCATCAVDARSFGVKVAKLTPCEAPTQDGLCGRPVVARQRCPTHYYRERRRSRLVGAVRPPGGALSPAKGRSPRITISLAPEHHARLLSEASAAGNTTSAHARLLLGRALEQPPQR
jgi:hypothetical protein